MYMFVLEWTPALTNSSQQSSEQAITIPHGYIFAAYMVAVMIGSNLFRILIKHQTCDQFMRPVLFTSAASLTVPFIFPTVRKLFNKKKATHKRAKNSMLDFILGPVAYLHGIHCIRNVRWYLLAGHGYSQKQPSA